MVSLQYGVAQSLNTVAVRTILKLGLDKSYQFMTENMGITTLTEEDRSATGALAPVSYTHLKKPAASRPRAFFRSRRYRKMCIRDRSRGAPQAASSSRIKR